MDLIAGLPGDSAEGFRASLEQVLDLGPENVTVHTLALKKGSRLMEEGGGLPSGAAVADMLDFAWAALRGAGQSALLPSTARSTCPAPLRTWAGAGPAPRASTTSA